MCGEALVLLPAQPAWEPPAVRVPALPGRGTDEAPRHPYVNNNVFKMGTQRARTDPRGTAAQREPAAAWCSGQGLGQLYLCTPLVS